jgi:hypothetical protein
MAQIVEYRVAGRRAKRHREAVVVELERGHLETTRIDAGRQMRHQHPEPDSSPRISELDGAADRNKAK